MKTESGSPLMVRGSLRVICGEYRGVNWRCTRGIPGIMSQAIRGSVEGGLGDVLSYVVYIQ